MNTDDNNFMLSLSSISINDVKEAIYDVITYDSTTISTKFNANVLFIIDNQHVECYIRNKVSSSLSNIINVDNDVEKSQAVTCTTITNLEQKEIIPDIIIETTIRTLQEIFTKKIKNPHTAILKGKIKIHGSNPSLVLKLQIIIDSTRKYLLVNQQQKQKQKQEHMLPKSRL